MNWTITGKQLILFLILAFTSPIWGTLLFLALGLALAHPILTGVVIFFLFLLWDSIEPVWFRKKEPTEKENKEYDPTKDIRS